MEKILTISVAAYNVEKYISETLESLVVPEIMNEMEVFVIDDGGKDKSFSIARTYEEKYPHTFHAVHKDNGGYGSVFNMSISKATGKYFKLLDGDDWFDKNGLKELISILKKTDADAIITNYYRGPERDKLSEVNVVSNSETGMYKSLNNLTNRPLGMWALTYRTETLRKSKIKLPEHTLYTDQYYNLIPLVSCNSIYMDSFFVYCYRFGYDEQSVSRVSRIKHTDEMLKICRDISVFAENNRAGNNGQYVFMRAANYHTTAIRTIMLGSITKENQQKIIDYENEIKEIAPAVYDKAAEMGKIGKLIRLFRKTNYKAYWLLKLVPGGIKNWQ